MSFLRIQNFILIARTCPYTKGFVHPKVVTHRKSSWVIALFSARFAAGARGLPRPDRGGPALPERAAGPSPATHAVWTQLKAGCLGHLDWDLSNLKAGDTADLLSRVQKTLLDSI